MTDHRINQRQGTEADAAEHYVAVPPDRDPNPVRAFKTFTGDLQRLADWLIACGVTTVAMEATGVYWIPIYEILEARGLEAVLVNARHVKNVPGRKSDVSDCEWVRELYSVGLLRGSFRPVLAIASLRAFLRHRETLVQSAATRIQRMQKALVQINLQLHLVVSDITGVTGLKILRDIVAGHTDPQQLARQPRPPLPSIRDRDHGPVAHRPPSAPSIGTSPFGWGRPRPSLSPLASSQYSSTGPSGAISCTRIRAPACAVTSGTVKLWESPRQSRGFPLRK